MKYLKHFQETFSPQKTNMTPKKTQSFLLMKNDEFQNQILVENNLEQKNNDFETLRQIYAPVLNKEKLVIFIKDTGVGISQHDQKKLFKLFGSV